MLIIFYYVKKQLNYNKDYMSEEYTTDAEEPVDLESAYLASDIDANAIKVYKENEFIIAPHPGGNFTHASFAYQSIYGKVSSNWKKIGDGYQYEIVVPSNCKAKVLLPNKVEIDLNAGSYIFN